MNKIICHKILANNLFAFEKLKMLPSLSGISRVPSLYVCIQHSTKILNWARKSKVIHIEFQKQHYPCWGGKIVYVENFKAYPNC